MSCSMKWKIVKARTTKINHATSAPRRDLEHYCRDLNGWPRADDEPPKVRIGRFDILTEGSVRAWTVGGYGNLYSASDRQTGYPGRAGRGRAFRNALRGNRRMDQHRARGRDCPKS